ncbi:DNA gyrase subunit A [Halorhodospira halophila]|uniref:DNA gyrase subunit A n=1 Tax=Halorhodospira halophila TaxID=1053 RepID=UPI00191486B3|nr:DNA gyrase subunit A [Halorhodospira halophila]MBK5936766.1 DNA gyrase subunit A [Halorhodospira halophila]
MTGVAREILPVNLEDEMRQSYLDYAMSVIVGRALPDVRDGLKPVHRRVLYAMRELGNDYNKPYKKSARVVGDVIGKYHPHGDAAVYDTIVRLAQTFSMRYRLVDGQGNFGSIDGDSPAAMRYTEVRMARLAHELLADIDKETVDFVDNYDGSEQEPHVLPTRLPNLLINGGSGIAVGMATNIPPHNLREMIDACVALVDDPELPVESLIEYVPAPDLPTGGIIFGTAGIHQAFRTGRGRMVLRARAEVEEMTADRERIVVTELPYQVNKARLVEKIAELVKERRLEGISELRDESDKEGIRIVLELKRGEAGEIVLNNLYRHTQMQTVFGINMVALHEGQPRTLNLRQVLEAFIRHRREVVTRRTIYELRKARERAHVLEGLAVALANIDEVIALIKGSSGPAEAKAELVARDWRPGVVTEMLERAGAAATRPEELADHFGLDADSGIYRLSEAQAQAILDLRLHRLTAMEQDKIVEEYSNLLERIAELIHILDSGERLMEVIREELVAIRDQYGDERKTEIREDTAELSLEDLISEEDMVVTLSHHGYVKAQPLDGYRAQRRGGRGKSATAMKNEDFIDKLFIANTHDTLLCFSSTGKCYWRKVYELPQGSRTSRGRPMVNLLPLEEDERINAVVPVREFDENHFVFMATRNGTVKKTPLSHFSRPRSSGIIALELRGDDTLVDAEITNGDREVMLLSDAGKALRFHESDVRAMGRTAGGVRGIRLESGQRVIALLILGEGDILTATEHGYGKRTPVADYPRRGRGGMGVICIRTTERNGRVVGAVQAAEDDEIMLVSRSGTLVRTPVADVSRVGRNTQGVKLISLDEDEQLVGLERVEGLAETEAPEAPEA